MIPSNAKKVFTGVIFDVYQWPQEMFDGSIETFEMLKRRTSTDVIATQNGKILLQVQEQPAKPIFLSFPGGQAEDAEDSLVGAKRELLEETGCTSNDWHLFSEVNAISKIDWFVYTYIARDCTIVQDQQLDAGERITIRWVTLDELIDLVDQQKFTQIEPSFRMDLVRAKYHPPARQELEKKIFGL
ncbi:MAG: NUDIX hydrolase [Patescibacteria group bacterium]